MAISYLDEILGSNVKVSALRLLVMHQRSFTGREIARRIGRSPASVHAALRELVDSGIVEAEAHPPAVLYRVADENLWVRDSLLPLFAGEASVQDRLRQEMVLAAGEAALSVVLFGSRAKRSSRPGSDLDLLIVLGTGADTDRIAGALADVSMRYGLSIEPLFLTETSLRSWARRSPKAWEEINASGVVLAGIPLRELRRHGGTRASGSG